MPAPDSIRTLIDRFHDDPRRYRGAAFNETEARVQFINPLFRALGWDMDDTTGRGEVKHEDRVAIAGKTKAPDYGFRLDGRLRFFVEAKKPSVDLDRHTDPAFQLRRYAWTAKLPLSVLTDFEEFAVYDTRVRPNPADGPRVARLLYATYDQYADRWDEIAAAFGRDAVLAGSLEQYAEEKGGRKGVAPVDAEFLKEIERFRDLLAHNIALRNPGLTERDLNFAVQQTIDRLLFLRIAEDRGTEPYGRLRGLTQGGDTYSRLFTFFNQADARYNSGLFHFSFTTADRRPPTAHSPISHSPNLQSLPDTLTPSLTIDDKVLKEIIKNLYEPISPYEFAVFPADILGQVYEQFLGKVIRLRGKSAVVEEKPEVRKAGGVYYTPTYIVDYIVRQTVGALLDGHTPDPGGPVSRLRVLDPACGSGSFLLGAYQYLLEWHRQGYLRDTKKWARKRGGTLYATAAGEYHLTLAERKRILLNNLYGVDIDPQAVEVTKLSLLLKVLEDTPEAIAPQLALLPERVLPDLGANIKCGNSLIGPDFYEQSALFPDEAMLRINAFDWRAEFKEIMANGGFDAVIGNPPWGGDIDDITWYIEARYPNSTQSYRDSFKLFIDKGITLTRNNGFFGFIVPSAFMFQPRYVDVRRMLRNYQIVKLWNVGDNVFASGVVAPSCLFIVLKSEAESGAIVEVLDTSEIKDNLERAKISQDPIYRRISQSVYERTTEETFVTYYRELGPKEVHLFEVLDCRDCGIKHQRVGVGMREKGKSDLASRLYYEGPQQSPMDKRYLIGADLNRNGWQMDYSAERYFRSNFKSILRENEIVYFNEAVFDLPQKIV